MQFKSLAYLLSVVAIVLAQSPQDILDHVATLRSQLVTLDDAINAFPDTGGDLTQDIHNDALNVQSAEDATTQSTVGVPAPLSETDGQNVIDAVNGLVPIIEDALVVIVEKKPAFDALPLGGISDLVRQDLGNLSASTSNLEAALIALAPPDLVDDATVIKNEVDAAFATAIDAYA